MTADPGSVPGRGTFARIFDGANFAIQAVAPRDLTQLALRVALAIPFWRSGINKWDGFLQLNDIAVLLFTSEFRLHLPGGPYAYPAPEALAYATGIAELVLPVLLVLGAATRLAALALLIMTIVIQITVPDGWPIHVTWAAIALAIMAGGAGRVSVDYLVARRL
jgi:putative oxidoreductase